MRLAILASHPVQYYAPLYRELAKHLDLWVFFAHRATPEQQAAAGFSKSFEWDIDLLKGYRHMFLQNVALEPDASRFGGCDTPAIGEFLDEFGPFDALLLAGWHLKSYWQGAIAAKIRGIPLLVRGDSHLETPRHWIKRFVKRTTYPLFLRIFDAALYVGERNRNYYLFYGYPDSRLFFSPHCVDNQRFSMRSTTHTREKLRAQLRIGSEANVALFAGKLIDVKRPLDVINAVALMEATSRIRTQVMIAGSGPLEEPMRDEARKCDVIAHFLGFQNQTQMPAAYAAADVLVLPSTSETWGLVCNEAMACGKPIVVSSGVGCAPDLTKNGITGRVFPVGDIRELADALGSILTKPPSQPSIQEVAAHYSISNAVDGIVTAVEFCKAKRRYFGPRGA